MNPSSSQLDSTFRRMWRWYYAVPPEKGAWVWWIGPMIVGIGAARHLTPELALLIGAALSGFMIKQPLTLVVKVMSGRRGSPDWGPGIAWTLIYTVVVSAFAAALAMAGHVRVLLTGAVGLPLFAWHLWLVSRGEERRQIVVDIAAAGVLALTAPAAYWTCGGADASVPWVVWVLTWLQSSASIVHAFLRLQQRKLKEAPSLSERWRSGVPSLLHHVLNVAVAIVLAVGGLAPALTAVAFIVPLADGIEGVMRPPVGVKPGRIGMRQLGVTSVFAGLMLIAYLV
ncbi:MAG: YwiC-like family protein [Candidatus Hydrogenedentes bacterium]|nr:YwiC-like family protein [Candidatus Hydrogenedentota bacterium]